jgi:hypothetical protein
MNKALADLMERNLLEVFGQVDSAREALNAKVGSILKGAPGFVFRAAGPAQVNHDLGRLRWQLGPAGAPPVVTGTDVAVFEHGRIRALYTFLDESAST